jgi:hypothetical protein
VSRLFCGSATQTRVRAENECLDLGDPALPNKHIASSKRLLETCLGLLVTDIGDMQKVEEASCYYPTRRQPDGLVLPPLVDKLAPWLFANIGCACPWYHA